MKFTLAIIVFFYLCSGLLWADECKAELSCSHSRVQLGDIVDIYVTVTCQEGSNVLIPENPPFGDLEILHRKQPVYETKNSVQTIIYQFEAAAYTLEQKQLGPVTVQVYGRQNAEIKTQAILLNIEELVTEEEAQIKDIKPIMSLNIPTYVYALLFLVIVLLAVLLYHIIKYLLNKPKKKAAAPDKTPEEIVELKLSQLAACQLSSTENIKQYYSALSEILRNYLDQRYDISAPDMTTRELYRTLNQSSFNLDTIAQIKALLEKCDLVKFAAFIPKIENTLTDLSKTNEIYQTIKVNDREEKQ